MTTFTLGGWVAMSHELGGKKQSKLTHKMYRACFFDRKEDRDAFYDLCVEQFPFETFYTDTFGELFSIQVKA